MKKIIFTIILFLLFSLIINSSEEKKIKVIVEGEEEAKTETAKDILPTTQKGVYILKTAKQIENDTKKLKDMADNPKIESEIIDAIISKIIDIENNQQKHMKIIMVLSLLVFLLFVIIVLIVIKRKY